jgi:hypothetical protein
MKLGVTWNQDEGDGNYRQKSKTEQAKTCLEENTCLTSGGKKFHENNGKMKIKIWIWTRVTKSQRRI